MAANQKIIDALTTLTSKFDEMNSKIDTLQTQNADLMKMIQSKPISKEVLNEQPTSKLELKRAELEAVKNSKKMKPDAKSKKIEKLEEQISKLESKEETKEEKKKLNLPRIGDKIKDSLKEVFGDKFAENSPNEFKEYVNSMTPDAYKAHNVKVHMENFLQTLSGGGGGGAPARILVQFLTLKELRKIENEVKTTDKVGIYTTSSGDYFTGPSKDEDEDLDEKNFDGETFLVGETTGRVYHMESEEFLGFWRSKGGLI
uniref:Uncharacterized protein n=1 Tax=viral metagenome TaxID=1070528 RepID=A0A6C0LC27_9ZZZZ